MGRKRTGTTWEKPKGSGRWIAAITLNDGSRETQLVTRKSGAPVDHAYARAAAREWQRRYDEGEWTPAPKPVPGAPAAPPAGHTLGTWATAWAAASTHKNAGMERWVVKRMLCTDPVADVALRSLATADVLAFIARLKARPSRQGGTLASRSVRHYVEITRRAVRAAVVAGHLTANPWDRLPRGVVPPSRDKVPGARRGWRYSPEEISLLIGDARVAVAWRVLWAAAFATGARGGELCAIRWEEWERKVTPLSRLVFARTISGRSRDQSEHETKTGAVKEVPVHPALEGLLAWWWSDGWAAHVGRAPTARDRIFPRPSGEHLYVSKLWWALQRACKAVGILPRRLHGTRHTTIRLAREGGADRTATRAITHTAPPTDDAFDGYDQPSWQRLCEAVLKLDIKLPDGRDGKSPDGEDHEHH